MRRAVAIAALAMALALPAGADASGRRIIDVPVAFEIVNTNTSGVPCLSDGSRYTVRGHMTGRRSAFARKRERAITLYLTGFDEGE